MECDKCNGEMNEYLPCKDCRESSHDECRKMISCKKCENICSQNA